MKNLAILALSAVVGISLYACSPVENTSPEPEVEKSAEATPAPKEKVVVEAPAPEPTPAPSAPASAAAPSAMDAIAVEHEWISIFNGENLDGWTVRGAATWEVKDGVLTGQSPGGQGHIYAAPELTDLEVKGMFKITDQGGGANSGLYFRANPPEDNLDGYPNGYEAQICHNQEKHTGWLWKPGAGVGKADKLITKDGEWFAMRAKVVGKTIQIWVQDDLVMTYQDEDYTKGFFALQCHNDGMTVEAKDLFYRDLASK